MLDQHPSPDGSHKSTVEEKRPAKSHRRGLPVVLVLGGVTVVVLALALGLGLGLGLKQHSTKSSISSGSSSGTTGSTGSSNTSLVSTPPESAFVLNGPVLASQPNQTRFYHFVVEQRMGSPDGYQKAMLVVNGTYPGPSIEVNEGDRIVVNVTNMMPNSTAIHWHGLYQRGTPWYDGTNAITQCGIPSGQSLTYNFTLDGWSGTTWWHAHYGTQYTDGITGALIVHAKNESIPAYDGDVMIQMADLYHRFSFDLNRQYLSTTGMTGEGLTGVTQGNEPVPDASTINGVGQWGNYSEYANFTFEANKTYRLRLFNTGSFAPVTFSVDSHVLTVVEADGTPITPYDVSTVTLDVAQRYSVLLRTNQTAGAYWVRGVLETDTFTYTEDGSNYNTLAVMRYGVSNATMPNATLVDNDPGTGLSTVTDMDVSQLVPAVPENPPNSTISYTITISMGNAAGNNWLSFLNTTSWSPLVGAATLFSATGNSTVGASVTDGSQFIINIPERQVVDIVVNNYDDGDHALHLHGHKMYVLGTGAGRYQGAALQTINPLRRDTVLMAAYTWTLVRFVADNPGMWAFHCHLSWHMSSGMLMQWSTLLGQAPSPPQIMLDQCASAKSAAEV